MLDGLAAGDIELSADEVSELLSKNSKYVNCFKI